MTESQDSDVAKVMALAIEAALKAKPDEAMQAKLKKVHRKNPESGQKEFGDKTPEWYSAVAKA
jgi:hypothetical protein